MHEQDSAPLPHVFLIALGADPGDALLKPGGLAVGGVQAVALGDYDRVKLPEHFRGDNILGVHHSL